MEEDVIEFNAKIEDDAIRVPERYRRRLLEREKEGPVRVTIHLPGKVFAVDLIDRLLESPLHVEGFVPLSRDQTHSRS